MVRFHAVAARSILVALALVLSFSSPLLAQRSDRGVIGGVVSDPQGSSLPGATVTVRNEATGVESVLTTNNAGAYTTSPLVLGPYSVTINIAGFKKAVATGIELRAGDVVRHDVALQIGEMTESVEVIGNDALADTSPDVAHSIDEKYYKDLPIVTAADVRLAESVLLMQPGYLPMAPNGDPMFRGSQFNSRINGGQARATENFFDGGAFGYASGHQGKSGERASHRSGQGGHGRHHDLLGPVRAHQRRLHRVHLEVGHQQVPRKRLRLSGQGRVQLPGLLQGRPRPRWTTRTGASPWADPSIKNKTFFFVNADWTQFRSGTLRGLRQHDAHPGISGTATSAPS